MFRRILGLAAVLAVLLPATVFGSGYSIYEQGAAVMGMAGAGTASVNDPSALFYQPSAITRLPGQHLQIGGHGISPVISFAGTPDYPGYGVTEEMTRQTFLIPNAYYTYNSGKKWAIGAGLNAPFGLGIEWKEPDTFTGRTIVTKGDLRTLNGNLTFAYAPSEHWSVAVGFDALFAEVELHSTQTALIPGGGGITNVATTELKSHYTPGYGWNAGFTATLNEQWRYGLNYRSAVIVDVTDGDATFTQIPYNSGTAGIDGPFNAAVAAGLPPNQKVGTTLRFPAIWSAGLAYSPCAPWTLEGDINLIQWSLFTDLPITFATTPSLNKSIVEDYRDVFQFRFGAEHRLPSWTYRLS